MSLHIHTLKGCSPTPLAHYLKALAVLRLISEQKDSEARGWWKDECFFLATSMEREELLQFFLEEYRPTPMLTPWNGGSGFYLKDKKDGLDAIKGSQEARFAPFREAIALGELLTHGFEESPKDEIKAALQAQIKQKANVEFSVWLNAAYVLGIDGKTVYPAMLGSGGNDGRLDFTNNYMQRLAEMFLNGQQQVLPQTKSHLCLCLFQENCNDLL